MDYEIRLTNVRGDELVFDFDTYILHDQDGLGMPPVRLIRQSGVTQDGSTFRDSYLDERQILFGFDVVATSTEDLWAKRRELAQFFASLQDASYLKVTDPSGAVYQIDVHFAGEMTFPRSAGDGPTRQRVALALWAGDAFYDPVTVVETLASGGGGSGMPIPLEIPMELGTSIIETSVPITYEGTWKSYPVIRINGPADDTVLENETTGRELDLTGSVIADGDWIEIDCAAKTVVDQDGVNQLALVTAASDLAEFYLAAHPEVLDGINVFNLVVDNVGANTRVTLNFKNWFIGV